MRVLVIEDYAPVRKTVAQALREAGFGVDVAETGHLGLRRAQSNDYDVIVLDLMLPGLDGFEILGSLRSAASQSHVLILTARGDASDRVLGLERGADDYLPKPFALEELIARVNALVRRRYEKKSPIIKVADLDIDTAARRVHRGGEEICLTAREYALLEYLALRRGEVVTRSQLWDHVYGMDEDVPSNVIDVYIGYLRRKIDGSHGPRLIHTRRGHGYVLEEGSG